MRKITKRIEMLFWCFVVGLVLLLIGYVAGYWFLIQPKAEFNRVGGGVTRELIFLFPNTAQYRALGVLYQPVIRIQHGRVEWD